MTTVAIAIALALGVIAVKHPPLPKDMWVSGYYTNWKQAEYPPSAINFEPLTHIVYFSLVPTATGDLAPQSPTFTDDSANAIRQATHDAGRKILICIGGADSAPTFEKAILPSNRAAFIKNLVDWTTKHGYDGIDLDMEPLEEKNIPNFQAFAKELKSAMDPHWQLTAATNIYESDAYLPIKDLFDQINIMTYDFAGPWEGYETWYNSPLFTGGSMFKSNGKPMPSVEYAIQLWEQKGFDKKKLGIGWAFFGYVWQGASGPHQPILGTKVTTLEYSEIINTYYKPELYHWDSKAHAPYLGIVATDKANQKFISYDDEKLTAQKVDFIRSSGIGGGIIWQLAADYFPGQTPNQPLLNAIAAAEMAHR